MFKLFTAFALFFVVGMLLSALFSGQSFGSETLSADISDSSDLTVIPITASAGYLNPQGVGVEIVVIENEIISYSGIETAVAANCPNPAGGNFSLPCLTGITRAQNSTDARSHPKDAIVYSELPGVINMLGTFQIAKNTINFGVFNTPIPSPLAFIQAIGSIVITDYAFLDNVQLLRMFVLIAMIGFVGALLIALFITAQGIFT